MTRTQFIGGRLFTVECAEPLAPQADWLLGVLSGLEAQHGALSDGAKIALGWSMITLREGDRGVTVLAPKYDGDPFAETTSDLTMTLLIQMEQNELLLQLGLEGQAASFQDKVVAARGALESTRVYLERTPDASMGDSGWYVGPVGSSADAKHDLEAFYVYELLHRRPSLLRALALPAGYLVVFNGDRIEAVLDKENRNLLHSTSGQ